MSFLFLELGQSEFEDEKAEKALLLRSLVLIVSYSVYTKKKKNRKF